MSQYDFVKDHFPMVGVGVMIMRDGAVLLGKRKGSHGSGYFAFPGGHLEHLEGFEECAHREVLEETGMEITNLKLQIVANTKKYAPRHYVHIGLVADWVSGCLENKEPDKCESWGWYALDNLPQPMMPLAKLGIDSYMQKKFLYQDIESSCSKF